MLYVQDGVKGHPAVSSCTCLEHLDVYWLEESILDEPGGKLRGRGHCSEKAQEVSGSCIASRAVL